ncbi:MAG TPA: hypothetical protein VEL80_05610 [Burkholderiales bacterium]|nr:hypothetical protein [Burkholderiales bacterium]
MRRRHLLERAAVAFAIFALAAPIHAQGYPSKPIRLIVGFPPGRRDGPERAQRTPLVPDAPTVAESGVPGCDIAVSAGLFALRSLSPIQGPMPAGPFDLLVGRAGVEPATNGLKVRCSTT